MAADEVVTIPREFFLFLQRCLFCRSGLPAYVGRSCVNEAGEFLFAPTGTVFSLTDGAVDPKSLLYKDLKAKHFIYDDASSPLLDILAAKIRTKYDHICDGTKLHIFVVTLRCEHSCQYCQVSRQTTAKGEFDMNRETADRSIALMLDSPSPHITVELQGGEPLLRSIWSGAHRCRGQRKVQGS